MKYQWMKAACLAFSMWAPLAVGSESFELKASIEFAPTPAQYLMVYASNEKTSGPNIYGKVLGPDGTPQGKDFRLSTQTGAMSKPDLAYGVVKQQFLTVWGRKLFSQNRSEIVGLLVGLDGKNIGKEFRISTSDVIESRPAIAYCPGRDRFLITWEKGTNYDFDFGNADVWGQFVDGSGALIGGNFVVAAAEKNQFKPDVTCDIVNDRFLVVWEDQRTLATKDDIYGQLISSDGTMLGSNYLVAQTPNIEGRPVLASNSKTGTYIAVWESVDTTFRMFSQILDTNGKPVGVPVELGTDLGGNRNRAAVAYLKRQNLFFVAFDNSEFNNVPDGIHGQFIEANGSLRQGSLPVTTAANGQFRPDVAAGNNSFLTVWTDFRTSTGKAGKASPASLAGVYEYFGRVISNDMALSARWRNPQSTD